MRDYISIGSSPTRETCFHVSETEDYYPKMKKECKIFVEQLRRQFGKEPDGAIIGIKHCEVVVFFKDNKKAVKYAYNIKENTPEKWDDISKRKLNNITR